VDARYLFIGDQGTMHCWDLWSERWIVSVSVGEQRITALALSPDGTHVAAATIGQRVRIFDIRSMEQIGGFSTRHAASAIGFDAGGKEIAAASLTDALLIERRLWRTEDLLNEACARLTRNFNLSEVKEYLGDTGYSRTCPDLPDDAMLALLASSAIKPRARRRT
jgi:WD40 repeat protein